MPIKTTKTQTKRTYFLSPLHCYHRHTHTHSFSLSLSRLSHASSSSSDAPKLAARAPPRENPALLQCPPGGEASLVRPSLSPHGLGAEAREGPEEARGDHRDGTGLRLW